MLFSPSFLILSASVTLAAATVAPLRRNEPTGSVECCASTGKASEQPIAGILKGLGVVVQDLDVLVGIECSPITVIGSASTCAGSSTAVTCTDNSHGLISIGCVPVTLAAPATKDVAPVRRTESTSPIDVAQCCGSTGKAGEEPFSGILGLLGIVVQDLNVLVGIQCSPVTVIGGSATCSGDTTAVTCTDNSHGLISIGCIIITL